MLCCNFVSAYDGRLKCTFSALPSCSYLLAFVVAKYCYFERNKWRWRWRVTVTCTSWYTVPQTKSPEGWLVVVGSEEPDLLSVSAAGDKLVGSLQ